MTKKQRELPLRVFEKHGSYYLVTPKPENRKKRNWDRLCSVDDGFALMYQELARREQGKSLDDMLPKICVDWMAECGIKHSAKAQADDRTHNRAISEAFAEFRANQIKPPDVTTFLKTWEGQPRSYNAYRSALKERLRFAEEKGYILPGANPVGSIKTKKVKARDRYITDSELRRIKFAIMYGKKGGTNAGQRTEKENRLLNRSGHTICCLIDMAYLTGQRIGDLLEMEWSAVRKDGLYFEPGKVEDTTAVKILIQWTPRLQAVVDRLKNPPPIPGSKDKAKPVSARWMFSTLRGQPYTYDAIKSAWARARERAKLKNAHFHDLRAKALTDKDEQEGMGAARTMGGHSTEQQTSDYVRHKKAKKTIATR